MNGSARAEIMPGTMLEFEPGMWKHGEGVLRIRVERVLHELSQWYTDEIWIEGTRMNEHHEPITWTQALVRVDAIPRA